METEDVLDKVEGQVFGEIEKLKEQIREEDGPDTQSVKDLISLEQRLERSLPDVRAEILEDSSSTPGDSDE